MEKYKTISIKIEDVKNIELNALQVYDDRYMKYKTRTYGDEVYTNFQGLDVSEHEVGCKSSQSFSIDLLPVYDIKYYMQVYWDNCAHEVVHNQIIDYLDGNLFEADED